MPLLLIILISLMENCYSLDWGYNEAHLYNCDETSTMSSMDNGMDMNMDMTDVKIYPTLQPISAYAFVILCIKLIYNKQQLRFYSF